jgi:hypothetical protein
MTGRGWEIKSTNQPPPIIKEMGTTIRRVSRTRVSYQIQQDYHDFQHRLGIAALDLDASNDGILYSGGRDGVVNAWNVHLSPTPAPWHLTQDDGRTRNPSGYSGYVCVL